MFVTPFRKIFCDHYFGSLQLSLDHKDVVPRRVRRQLDDDGSRIKAQFAGLSAQLVAPVDAISVDRQTQLVVADFCDGFRGVFFRLRNSVQ